MIQKIITFLEKFITKEKQIIVYLWEFQKQEIDKSQRETYLLWKDVLAIELIHIKNRLISLYQQVRTCKTEEERISIQAKINERYWDFNRINMIINPEDYMTNKK